MANKNTSKRFKPKMRLKKGDNVIVIAGAEKGATGEILSINATTNRVLVKEVNIVSKHVKPTAEQPGRIDKFEAPIHISNVMLLDPKSGSPTKVGRRIEDGKIVRFSKLSGETIK